MSRIIEPQGLSVLVTSLFRRGNEGGLAAKAAPMSPAPAPSGASFIVFKDHGRLVGHQHYITSSLMNSGCHGNKGTDDSYMHVSQAAHSRLMFTVPPDRLALVHRFVRAMLTQL